MPLYAIHRIAIESLVRISGMEGNLQLHLHLSRASKLVGPLFVSIGLCLTVASMMFWLLGNAVAQDRSKRPLIFVPGIFGSKLCEDGDPKKLLWGSVLAWKQLPLLKLNADGRTSKVRVEACGPIDEFVYFGHLGQDVYGKFLDSLAPDYKLDTNLFVFSYDWRLSSFDNAERFEAAIERYAKLLHLGDADQFDVVAHSMGGLVVTISLNGGNRRIHRLVTVSTPFQGSVEVFPSLEGGWGWLQRQLVSMQQVRDTVLSFPLIAAGFSKSAFGNLIEASRADRWQISNCGSSHVRRQGRDTRTDISVQRTKCRSGSLDQENSDILARRWDCPRL